MARSERHIYDPQNGLPGTVGLYQAKPPTYLDVPSVMQTGAVSTNAFAASLIRSFAKP